MGPGGFAAVGLTWGGVAWLLARDAFGAAIWAGVAASPLIGVLLGLTTHRRFVPASLPWRAVLAVASLYLGAVLFGLAVGAYEGLGSARGLASVAEGVAAMLYGTTLYVMGLGPLAFLTHLGLASDVAWWRRP